MAFKTSSIIIQIKSELAAAFSIVDIGLISFYLELKIECNQGKQTIKLLQPAYIDKIFSKFYINKANAIIILIQKHTILKTKTKNQAFTAK